MILYHFTKPENVAAIQRDGLLPSLTGDSVSMVGCGPPVVFLCDTPTTAVTDQKLRIFRQRCPDEPIVSKRWLGHNHDKPLVRFTVRLPSSDRKLKRYRPWLRRHLFDGCPDPDDDFSVGNLDTWWIYFGAIPPSKIIDCTIEAAQLLEPATAAEAMP
jgi:hypothetical protein